MTDGAPDFQQARLLAYSCGQSLTCSVDVVSVRSDFGTVPPAQGIPQFLAADIHARNDVPVADCSAMDGYAVAGPPPWRFAGEALPGEANPVSLEPGTAIRVGTGSVIPNGTEAVVRWEDVESRQAWRQAGPDPGLTLGAMGAPKPPDGDNIRRSGEETRLAERIGVSGQLLTSSLRGAAAAAGLDELQVARPPRIALLATGDELQDSGVPSASKIRDALTPTLRSLLPAMGAGIGTACLVPDSRDAAQDALLAADSAAIILSTGMASAGPRDYMRDVLADLGAEMVIDNVQIRPGRPQGLAILPDGRMVALLPGNPFAAISAMVTIVQPLIAGALRASLPAIRAVARHGSVPKPGAVTRLYPARWSTPTEQTAGPAEPSALGIARLDILPWRGSAQLRGLAEAEALLIVPPTGEPGYLPLP
ncbi:molybdopterin-binding protein [Saxibacter everestensis]|uniref:Molybdopterin molybdenumtransferase n=1 Tax=Saxibacter everestensis TaxID=2909229 RepID=A0ABY8QQK5_9MICO|nr:molybdopterin-binding protein [Brevibacteriaceae bacterium ZFBP1038]